MWPMKHEIEPRPLVVSNLQLWPLQTNIPPLQGNIRLQLQLYGNKQSGHTVHECLFVVVVGCSCLLLFVVVVVVVVVGRSCLLLLCVCVCVWGGGGNREVSPSKEQAL